MPADPFYARSSLGGATAAPVEAPPVEDGGTPAEGSGPSETQETQPNAGSETPPTEGSSPAVEPEQHVPPDSAEAVAGEPTPEKPADETPEDPVARANELLKLVKENPAKFASDYGLDLAPRFAKLGNMAADIRKKEAALKELEASSAERVKKAEEVLDMLERDKVGFVHKYLGQDGMERLNRAALAKDDPSFAAFARLEEVIDAQNRKIEELTGKLDNPQQPEIDPAQSAETDAYFSHKANEFATDYSHLSEQPENKRLIDFFGDKEVREDALSIVTNVYRSTGRQLTAEEVWSMLRTEFDERFQKVSGTSSAETPSQQPQQASSEPGPETNEQPPKTFADTDFSPAAERARMAAIAARHTKA